MGTQWIYGGIEGIGVGFQQRSAAGSKMCKKGCIHTIANGFAISRPGKPVIHLRCPRVGWYWICECCTDEGCLELFYLKLCYYVELTPTSSRIAVIYSLGCITA